MPSKTATEKLIQGTIGAILMGRGTSSNPITISTASKNFLQFYVKNTANTGDNRGLYLRQYLTGSGAGGGEAARIFSTVEGNLGTVRGAHISLSFSAVAGGSECSGLGSALTGTLHIPDIASWAPTGTYAAGDFEIYSDGAASDPAGMTELSVLRLSNSGDGTGKADVDTDAYLLSIQGFTAATGVTKVLSSTSLAELPAGTVGLRIKVGATMYYIPAVVATEWN